MKNLLITLCLLISLAITGCSTDAEIASRNVSKAADNFEVYRRVVFFNGITDNYLLSIEGYCSTYNVGNFLEVTCKTGPSQYKKHFLGLSDNVSYFTEQLDNTTASSGRYRVVFKPSEILPDIDMR